MSDETSAGDVTAARQLALVSSQSEAEAAAGRIVARKERADYVDKLVNQALAIEEHDAREAGTIGFMARVFVQTTIPHSKPEGTQFVRSNGNVRLTITSIYPDRGLPYGSYPRLLLAWMTTEAVRTKSPVLELGYSLSDFMRELGLMRTGGRWGTITRLRDQMLRLFSSAISCRYEDKKNDIGQAMLLADGYDLWWSPKAPEQIAIWKSKVILNDRFFQEIIKRPVPIDMRALYALKQSPMALDIYTWLTFRLSYLRETTVVPWAGLQRQLGCDFTRTRSFREKFLQQLRRVRAVYPAADVMALPQGLQLRPSFTHVPRVP